MGPLGNVGVLIIGTLGSLYLLAVLLRFLLQIARANFYNPLVQAIVQITDNPVRGLRRVIPGMWGIDFATLIYAILVHGVFICLLAFFYGFSLSVGDIGTIITWASVGTLSYILKIYFWAIIASIVASFIAPYSAHPAISLTRELSEPIMAPFRRLLPAMGGLDFSPIFAFLCIRIIETALIYPILGDNQTLIIGY
ncbi:MAG: YggT family protein [Pseudohongiellaceae bacterium]|nr:YggT family protein [Pseudohongiellaceae bacterium]